jgi:murein L,D-transpeptidase YafK
MSKSLLPIALAALLGVGIFTALKMRAHAKDADSGLSRFAKVKKRVAPQLEKELAASGLRFGAPVFMRILKEEKLLELWIEKTPAGKYALFKTYKICTFSGTPGPKQKQGDRQAPEGFYAVSRARMNPQSSYHLSFDLGYPNKYDRGLGRTGSLLMVHGNCVSVGCYAMTDPFIEEIYTLADAALAGGQKFFRVHCLPFKMSSARMTKVTPDHQWRAFWTNLKDGYDWFERERRPPDVTVREKKYQFAKD